MRYDPKMRGRNLLGEFSISEDVIRICPTQQERNRYLRKRVMDLTIVHEWMHAFEYYVLDREFNESDVEWWSRFVFKRRSDMIEYIRSFFREEGF